MEKSGKMTDTLYHQFNVSKNISRKAYNLLISENDQISKYFTRWIDEGIPLDFECYTKGFASIRKITRSTKLRDFQYRLLLNKIITNDKLYEWQLTDCLLCMFCKNHRETIEHLFWECEKIKLVWTRINELIPEHKKIDTFNTVVTNVWLGKSISVIEEIILITKQFIYRRRCLGKPISVKLCEDEIRMNFQIQLFNAKKGGTLEKTLKKWSPINFA